MSSTIQIRVDDDLKTKADELFRELGTDTTSAIRYRAIRMSALVKKS